MNVVSLFAGIGGFDLGLERAGFTTVCQVENDPFCQRVLAARWSHVACWPDVREWQGDGHEPVDLLVGGFPCQDLSVAGKRAGLRGDRSGLFYEYVRIAKALAPTWGIVENVPGLLSIHRGRDFWLVLQGLRECWPVVGWRIVDSQYFGVPQRRRRVFLVGGPTEAGVAQVLALTDGGGGDLATGGEAGADLAYALAAGVGSRFGSGRGAQDTFVTATLNSGGNDGIGRRSEDDPNLVVTPLRFFCGCGAESIIPLTAPCPSCGRIRDGQVTHALTGVHGATEDGTGRGMPLVAFDTTQITSDKNYSNPRPGDPCHPLAAGAHAPAIGHHGAQQGSSIRRLTPLECERLQGFPDGWTCLCTDLSVYAADPDAAALACRCPDSPRYRALGNAVTVNVLEWLGQRLMAVLSAELRP